MSSSFEQMQTEAWDHAEHSGFHKSRGNLPECMRRIVVCGLIHTEVSEAIEAARKGETDNYMEELADIVIRVMDEAEQQQALGYERTLAECIIDKQAINRNRRHMHGKRA